MTKIIDISELRAKDYEAKAKRLHELERLVHICMVTTQSILDIQSPDRFLFSGIVEKYKNAWEKELEILKNKING